MKIQRRHLSQHKAGECSKRLLGCRYCSKEFVADTLAAHHVKCGRVPVACPNRCDANVLAREELDTHLKEECTVSVMCCSFKDAGCRFKVRYLNDFNLNTMLMSHFYRDLDIQWNNI